MPYLGEKKKSHKQNQLWTRGVWHYGLAIYIKKYLKAKEELWKLKYFTMQKYNLKKKNPLKETKILQDIMFTLLIDLEFQHKPKYHVSKILV
jgi:hypothetical protein